MYTCGDSWAAVTCAKFWPNLIILFHERAIHTCTRFDLLATKIFCKMGHRATGGHRQNTAQYMFVFYFKKVKSYLNIMINHCQLTISILYFFINLTHSSLGDWEDIFITHLIIIIKLEVSTSPIVVRFFCGCVSAWSCCTIICCRFYINPRKSWVVLLLLHFFIYFITILRCVQIWSSALWPYGHIGLLTHYTNSLSSLCRHIWRYWVSKILVRYILSSVCLWLSQFSELSYMQLMGLCVFVLPISVMIMMIVRISVLYLNIIIKSEVWPICHCLGLGHETIICSVCLSIFLKGLSCFHMIYRFSK